MVGTAEYQFACESSSQEKNLSALNPGGQKTLAPARIEEVKAPISPWIWNSGMITRQRSAGVSARQVEMLRAEASRFFCASGTILGREVVPEVCSTRAPSSAALKSGLAGATGLPS